MQRAVAALLLVAVVAMPLFMLVPSTAQTSQTTYTYTYEFTEYPPRGWALIYTWATYTVYPSSIGVDSNGLYVVDSSTTEDVQTMFTWALPHANQSYTAEAWFMPSVDDITKDFSMRVIVGGALNASHLYFVVYSHLASTLAIKYYDTSQQSSTQVESTADTYSVSNNNWYRIWVNVTWTGSGILVSAELRDAGGATLLSLSNVELSGVHPIFGVGMHMGAGQTGRVYVKNATITFYGEPNVKEVEPVLDPDYTTYDWVGAPFRVFFQHSDGRFYPYAENGTVYFTIRWHGEGSGTGDKIDLYKVVGDPRDPSNWVYVKTVVTRTQLGWSLLEECNLVILNNGTWIAFVAGGTTYAVHRLVSNDEGATWTDEGVVINGKHNHLWVDENGTMYMAWWDMSNTIVHISRSTDLGTSWTEISQINGYSTASIYRYGDKYYILAGKIVETDNANYHRKQLDLFTSSDMVSFFFEKTVYRACAELPFTLYMNGLGYPELTVYSTVEEDYMLVVAEWSVVDHDANDGFNDQNQRHLGVLVDPVTVFTKEVILLPYETLYITHDVSYSPNSTQFTHSFTAANTTTAGYETGYSDAYGWRVYAEPYQSAGVSYENNASLVSEINISLPYTEVLVKNITLLAKTNGTGSYRQLWIRVLDSTGGVVAEIANATIGTTWTEVVLTINTNLSNQLTLWINATVESTTTVGEEIAVKDVRVYIEYSVNPEVIVPLSPNVDYFNCSASHFVELGSTDYLNSSSITFKLIDYLTLNTTDYPVEPVYVGNETIDSRVYRVYRVEPANYSQYLTIYALLENKLKTFRTHARGFDTETVLIGEPLTIELPEPGNITVVELNETFTNVTSVTLRFSSVGIYTVKANLTQPSLWRLGYSRKIITVKYGAFAIKPVDIDSKVVDYEDLVLQLVNKTSGAVIKELSGNKLFSLDSLWAGNYSLVIKFKDIVVGARDFELNITTDGSIINISCSMRSLTTDYRGFNRTVVYELGKQLLGVESISSRFPYSRMRILLNGTGSFKLYINYRGDLPTKVSVTGNVTLKYYWDGYYLVVEGSLGSVGEINVTDLYKLRLEVYDRLGNLMPSWIYAFINETKYYGAVVEDYLYPEDYVIKLPSTINGFVFYSFFDGFNETVRTVTINNSDVTLKAWYRVPTAVKEVRSFQVASLWWMSFIKQDSDRVKVYIEGYLRDYYGNGVPSRPVVINITDVEAGFTWSINTTTDATGYWRTPLLELVRGRVYRIEVVYAGDDIYVGSYSTMEVKPEELPVAPAAFEIPVEYLIAAAAAILVAAGVAAALRTARHVIEDLREKPRRFVKRKG